MSERLLQTAEERLLDATALPGQVNIPITSPRRTVSGPPEGEDFTKPQNGSPEPETQEERSLPAKMKAKRGSLTQQLVGGLERIPSKLGMGTPSPKRQDSLKGAAAIGLLAMNKIRTKDKAKQARTVLQGLPMWLSKEVLARTTKRINACKPSQKLAVLRVQNSVMQAEQPIWQKLLQILTQGKDSESAKKEVLEIVRKMQQELEQRERCHPDTAFFVPGPVGDTVLHMCFLLGLVELGKQLVCDTYNTPELVSLPYTNDLKVWFDAKVVGTELDDNGLYTGQTVLHIAIVRKDKELVQFLLGYQANIVARATGAFFKPKRCVTVLETPTRSQRFVAWIRGMDLSKEPLVEVKDVADSGCYYGEYPLSFAVSIGSVELCTVLFYEYQARKQAKDPHLKELYENMAARTSAEGEALSKFRDVAPPPPPVEAQTVSASSAKRGSALSDNALDFRKTEPCSLQSPPDSPSPPIRTSQLSSARRRIEDDSDEEFGYETLPKPSPGLNPTKSVPTPTNEPVRPLLASQYRRGSNVQAMVHPVYSSLLPFDLFINVQDSFGNTALHMAVLHRRPATMRWLIKSGADRSMSILNDESYTPLTLAARLGYLEELEVLLSHSRVIAWTFGDVQMVRTPLEQVDTFRIRGSHLHARPNWRSVIEVVVAHEVETMCDHPLFDRLIKDKWAKFARRAHLVKSILPFFFGVLTTSLYLYARCFHQYHQLRAWVSGARDTPGTRPLLDSLTSGDEGREATLSAALSLTCLLVIVLPAIRQGWALRRLKQQDLDPNGDGDVSLYEVMLFVYKNLPFMLTWGLAAALLVGIFSAFVGASRMELQAISVGAVLHWSMLLLHLSSFQSFGVLVIIIFKMLIGDIFKFLVVYVILVVAFSQALFALTQMSHLPAAMETLDYHPGRAFFSLVWVSLGARPLQMDKWHLIKHTVNPSLTLMVYIVYVVLCTILMLNLLIAMMQKTFRADMRDTYKTWIFPFAQLVLRYESELKGPQRLACRSGRPAGLQAVHDVEAEQYYETAVVPSEKSKREQHDKQERLRMELVMQVLTEYLDVGLGALKRSLNALSEEAAAFKRKGFKNWQRSELRRGSSKNRKLWDSEYFEDDDSPVNTPLTPSFAETADEQAALQENGLGRPAKATAAGETAPIAAGEPAPITAGEPAPSTVPEQPQENGMGQAGKAEAAESSEARALLVDEREERAPAPLPPLLHGQRDAVQAKPRRQLTLKKLPAPRLTPLQRLNTDGTLLEHLPVSQPVAVRIVRASTLKKLPTQIENPQAGGGEPTATTTPA